MGADEPELLDRATFDDFAGLFEPAELREVVDEWHDDSGRALAAIEQARAGGDRARIADIAHRTAGGGMAIGALALARACERLRAAASSPGPVGAEPVGEPQVAAVREALALTYDALIQAASHSP
ncbi:MAG: Hpt domain-containing protein [Thermoleophilia bacterium]